MSAIATIQQNLKTIRTVGAPKFQPLAVAWTSSWGDGPRNSSEVPGVLYLKSKISSGKSFLGSHFACSRALADPTRTGLIVANSESLLNTLTTFVDFCQQMEVPLSCGPFFSESGIRADPEWLAEKILQSNCCYIGGTYVLVSHFHLLSEKTMYNLDPGWAWFDEWSGCDIASVYEFLAQAGGPNSSHLAFVSSANGHNDPSFEKIKHYFVEGLTECYYNSIDGNFHWL